MKKPPLGKLRASIVALGVAGWVISYGYFGKYLVAHDWDMLGGWAAAFSANDWATGLLMDLVLVTFMVIALALDSRKRIGGWWTAAIIGSLSLSVSVALALYLIARWRTDTTPDH